MVAATFSDPRSASSWHSRHRKDFGSLQRVVLVVMNRVPPTLSLTHSFLLEEVGVGGVPFVAAAISKQVSAERDVAANNLQSGWVSYHVEQIPPVTRDIHRKQIPGFRFGYTVHRDSSNTSYKDKSENKL